MAHRGRVVVVTGPSSAGKSTLTTAFRDRCADRGELWFRVGIDLVLAEFQGPWVDVGWPGGPGPFAADGMRIVDGDRVEVGPLLRSLLRGYQRLVADVARSGVDVVVDDCVLDAVMWQDWQDALDGLDVIWIGVTACPETLTERELRRGDRPVGLAAAQRHAALAFLGDARVLDTTSTPVETLVLELDRVVATARPA